MFPFYSYKKTAEMSGEQQRYFTPVCDYSPLLGNNKWPMILVVYAFQVPFCIARLLPTFCCFKSGKKISLKLLSSTKVVQSAIFKKMGIGLSITLDVNSNFNTLYFLPTSLHLSNKKRLIHTSFSLQIFFKSSSISYFGVKSQSVFKNNNYCFE